jgi:protein farnesyltransferase/geranylgeranyltransferase type-1 subunit alpha
MDKEKEIPFGKQELFADVIPVEQNDGPNPVCPIAYTNEFVDAMNYFRAMLGKDERSERALVVVRRVIKYNSACYTAWYFLRLVLKSLGADLKAEMELLSEMAKDHPKNYQIWYHRRWLVEETKDASQELSFTEAVLVEDAKNYHAWTHRQWVISTFNLYENELAYVEKLLTTDIRNNSAWNQRYFVMHHAGLNNDCILSEVKFSLSKIALAPNNECPWNYLIGLFKASEMKISECQDIIDFCAEKEEKWPHCANLLSLLLDISEESGNHTKAISLCQKLRDGVDDIHKKYWTYRLSLIPGQS